MLKILALLISSLVLLSCQETPLNATKQATNQEFWGKDSVWFTGLSSAYPVQIVFRKDIIKITTRYQGSDTIFLGVIYPSDTAIISTIEVICAIETITADTVLKMQVSAISMSTIRQYDRYGKYADYYFNKPDGMSADSCYRYKVQFKPTRVR